MPDRRVLAEKSFDLESRFDAETTQDKIEFYFNSRFWRKHVPRRNEGASLEYYKIGDKSRLEMAVRNASSLVGILAKAPSHQKMQVTAYREMYGRRHIVSVTHLGDRRFRFDWCLESAETGLALVGDYDRDYFRRVCGWATTALGG